MNKNILIAHGGAPTAVINASLAGAIRQIKISNFKGKIYAARYGSKGLYNEDFIDLTNINESQLETLIHTPGSAIGTSRFPLYEKEYEHIVDILIKHNIGYLLFTGGNGSMDTIGNIYKHAKARGVEIYCAGIPKTIDNDVSITDHAPGFISAAQYMAQTVSDCAQDVKGLPIHVCVIEAMGRNAGWLTAASSLARKKEGDAPHLLYFPEIPFDEEVFLEDVKKQYELHGGVIVVASEGLKDKDGKPIVEPIFKTDRATYYGDVSSHLANLIIKKLGIKARSEKPGLIARCCSACATKLDIKEALLMGKKAAEAVLNHQTGVMPGLKRISSNPYRAEVIYIPIEEVMMHEAKMPKEFISNNQHDVSQKFVDWITPLLEEVRPTISFLDK